MIVAIDGYSSCGKSTLAKALAKKLAFSYVDTGAMYRAVTYYFMKHDIVLSSEEEVSEALNHIEIDFQLIDGNNTCFLNGDNIEAQIRNMRVSNNVSEVAALGPVREILVANQRKISELKSVVMDGRDIGTVVFPNAEVKFFITADKDIRAKRRFDEIVATGKEVSLREVVQNLEHRDTIDTTREISPLRKAHDAIEIDNTYLSREEQLDLALEYIAKASK